VHVPRLPFHRRLRPDAARRATAQFLDDQAPRGSAYVIGEAGLLTGLHDIGYVLTDAAPDYVVLGETRTYSFEAITKAIRLVESGSRFIATNPDPTGPSLEGSLPACGAVAALITRATGVEPYFVGKPNPLMMRSALNRLEAHSETTIMIGDRMDTGQHVRTCAAGRPRSCRPSSSCRRSCGCRCDLRFSCPLRQLVHRLRG
jgi:ribonucleotide monophosphatase NagD (HAD superfamily)